MSDVLGVSANPVTLTHWTQLVSAAGLDTHAVPLMSAPDRAVDRWLIVLDDRMPSMYRSWLRSLDAPIALIAPALDTAARLLDRVPQIRVLCHTSRAQLALDDLLSMTESITAGALVLGPALPDSARESRLGGDDVS